MLCFADHQIYKIASCIDEKTSIQLARHESVDSRLFSPPINKYLRKDNIFDILSILDQKLTSQVYNKYHASIAFKARERWKMMHFKLDEEVREKYFSQKKCHLLCLQALLKFSAYNEEACQLMTNAGLLASLHTIREMYHDDIETNTLIARIFSNISQYQFSKSHFFKTGWIKIFSQWMNEEKIELSLTAAKILFNLDNDKYLLSDNIFLLYPNFKKKEVYHYDVVFIHGLMGSVFKTWRQSDKNAGNSDYTKCWPQTWLSQDIKWLRLLAIDYQTQLTDWETDSYAEKTSFLQNIESIVQQLIKAGIGKRPLILVGHSMGGILAKQILVSCSQSSNSDYQDILKQTKGVVFYSVPHRGSEMINWPLKFQKVVLPSQDIRHLMKG